MTRLAALLLLSMGVPAPAHQFHYSRTEINWNTKTRTLEIVATLHADDIEAFLRKGHRQLELDRDKAAESLVCAYVLRALEIEGARPRCLGMKVARDYVDVFLEAPAQNPPRMLTNRILIEDLEDQRNDVECKKDGRYTGPRIQFNHSEIRKELRW